MGFVSYKVENDKEFQATVDKAFAEVRDLRIAFRQIARDFYKSERAIFKLKGPGQYEDFKGPRVADLWKNPGRPNTRTRDGNLTAYQNWKIKQVGFDYPLLKLTGDLESSVTGKGRGSILNIEKDFLEIGTSIPYANYHQQDNPDKGSAKIPTRKFLFIGPESVFANSDQRGRLDRWTKIIESHVAKNLERMGRVKNV